MTGLQKWIIGLTGMVLLGLIVWIFWYLSQTTLSTQLNTLFNVLLTIFSVLLSLVISHYYFDSSRQSTIENIKNDYQRNNRLYSQKAAEKVDNLSNELTKLSIYLQQSIDDDSDLDPATALLVREEKIRSAIHIVETLKSINDKSLSDWLGVLNEEDIEEQNEIREEKREEREDEFRSILDSYRTFVMEESNAKTHPHKPEEGGQLETVHGDLSELTKKIDRLATTIIGTPIKSKGNVLAKEQVKNTCPVCNFEVSYRQRPSEKNIKALKCPACNSRLISRWSIRGGFKLSERPTPKNNNTADPSPKILPEDVIGKVQDALPPQPWPKGTSNDIATKLGLSKSDMRRAIKALISRGVFKNQVNGELFEPAAHRSEGSSSKNNNSSVKD